MDTIFFFVWRLVALATRQRFYVIKILHCSIPFGSLDKQQYVSNRKIYNEETREKLFYLHQAL